MARVVPGQVVDMIDRLYPKVKDEYEGQGHELNYTHLPGVIAVVELAKQIPDEFIIIEQERYSEYSASIAVLTGRIRVWETQGNTLPIRYIEGLRKHTPIRLIRDALIQCPSQVPSPRTAELKFIRDKKLKDSLRLDISTINTAYINREWKAATILAGSVVEALILWAVRKKSKPSIIQSVQKLKASGKLSQKTGHDPLGWGLEVLAEVAADFNVITAETLIQTHLARDYRNLIHPGRELRLKVSCDAATATTAIAAMQHVIRDLS